MRANVKYNKIDYVGQSARSYTCHIKQPQFAGKTRNAGIAGATKTNLTATS